MTSERDLAAEFRSLAEAVLDRVDPVIRRFETDRGATAEWQGCSWCPLCALAAMLRGERHDLLTLVSTELDTVLVALRDLLRDHGDRLHPSDFQSSDFQPSDFQPSDARADETPTADRPPTDEAPTDRGRRAYEPIAVTVREGQVPT